MRVFLSSVLVVCLLLTFDIVGGGEPDFYSLLGVAHDADDRAIRRAFKKLALREHPDKNQGDENAHSKFVRINRAYEVLKDPELRKKYDLHGEDGLKDDFHGGGNRYQSWQYYNDNFGIYDEDPEIVTLNEADFEQSVSATDDRWFINFYSPQCSHCHELAPTWRAIGREFAGAVRIGAVNCGDEWMLCREQNIFSYPSLVMYPGRAKYQGVRDHDSLETYIMGVIKASVHAISSAQALKGERAWLLDFCGDDESVCLSAGNRKKVAAILDGLVDVGTVACDSAKALCDQLGLSAGVAFFPASQVTKQAAHVLASLDAQELADMVLHLLPDVPELTEKEFASLEARLLSGDEMPVFIHFVSSVSTTNLELKKLPALLQDIPLVRVNCSTSASVCARLQMGKLPAFAVLKRGGGHELHHGRQTAHDLAAFARESAATNVRALDAAAHARLMSSGALCFVDYFAPWCPPCMKLLPEFRKAARMLGDDVQFGTVDCTQHAHLCQQMNVHSYPTSVFYNDSQPHSLSGLHSVDDLVTFVQDVRNPPVVALTAASFAELVTRRANDVVWLVDFFAPWCGPCQQLAPEWRRLAKMLKDVPGVWVGSVDCQQFQQVCVDNQVRGYPSVRVYPAGRRGFEEYRNWFRDASSMRQWVQNYLPSKVAALSHDDFFSSVLSGEQAWLIDFYAPWCGHCQVFAPAFEVVANRLEGQVRVAKVDCDAQPNVCRAAGVNAYPTVRLYAPSGGTAQSPDPSGFNINSQDARQIVAIVKQRLRLRDEL